MGTEITITLGSTLWTSYTYMSEISNAAVCNNSLFHPAMYQSAVTSFSHTTFSGFCLKEGWKRMSNLDFHLCPIQELTVGYQHLPPWKLLRNQWLSTLTFYQYSSKAELRLFNLVSWAIFLLVVSPAASCCLLQGALVLAQNKSQIKAVALGSLTIAGMTLLGRCRKKWWYFVQSCHTDALIRTEALHWSSNLRLTYSGRWKILGQNCIKH